jgi:DNA (cytosine-5)-methyltransferase 1
MTVVVQNGFRARVAKSSSAGTFIDLFAGCGGLSLGLMTAGWRGLFAIEKEENAFETVKFNLIENQAGRAFDWPSWLPKTP